MNRLARAPVGGGIALGLDLFQGATLGAGRHQLKLNQINVTVEAQGQIQPPGVAALLWRQVQAQAGEVGIGIKAPSWFIAPIVR